ncbi:MAG: hypothetical protein L0338_33275 [Acidobacteria bacterium]|nr:hypothetical protein [Acidobacteriota bacterium]
MGVRMVLSGTRYQALLNDPEVDVIYNPLPNHLHAEVDHFSRCILKAKPLAVPPEESVKNMRVIEALQRSARLGSVVRL